MKLTKYFTDRGYSINKVYCGKWHKEPVKGLKQGQQYALKYMGQIISFNDTIKDCCLNAIFHDDNKSYKIL